MKSRVWFFFFLTNFFLVSEGIRRNRKVKGFADKEGNKHILWRSTTTQNQCPRKGQVVLSPTVKDQQIQDLSENVIVQRCNEGFPNPNILADKGSDNGWIEQSEQLEEWTTGGRRKGLGGRACGEVTAWQASSPQMKSSAVVFLLPQDRGHRRLSKLV